MKTDRRKFLQIAGFTTAGLAVSRSWSHALPAAETSWGVQLFTIPQMVSQDLRSTLEMLGDIGYKHIEFFGPYDFSAPKTIERWKGLASQMGITKNAFYGYKAEEVKAMLQENGLSSPSVHLDIITMRENMDPAMEQLAAFGTKYVAIPALLNPAEMETLDDFKRLADEFNSFGKQMNKHGLTFVYHNHGYEHWVEDGMTPMEILMDNTDKDLVKFELDVFWMTAAGADPIDFLNKYKGRYKLMHIKDAQEKVRFAGDGKTPEEWMALFPKMSDPGSGVLDIEGMVKAGINSGVEHFYLERDLTPTPEETLKKSFDYFKTI